METFSTSLERRVEEMGSLITPVVFSEQIRTLMGCDSGNNRIQVFKLN